MKRKSIKINEELHTKLKVMASEQKLKLKELVELIIREYIE